MTPTRYIGSFFFIFFGGVNLHRGDMGWAGFAFGLAVLTMADAIVDAIKERK